MDRELVASLGTALAVGLLIGLERQRAITRKEGQETIGGVRTFPLIALVGAVAALLTPTMGSWILPAALLGLVAVIIGHRIAVPVEEREVGVTSDVAAVVTLLLGALAPSHQVIRELTPRLTTTLAIAVVVALLLSVKPRLHAMVQRISDEDVFASLQILVVGVVLLPLLPDQGLGPFEAINPQHIGRMILFVGGVSFVGYLASRMMGPGRGLTITGVVGGLVSSTAVTFSMSRRAKESPADEAACALAVIVASTIMFVRVIAACAVVYPPLVPALLLPMAAMGVVGVVQVLVLARQSRGEGEKGPTGDVILKNPFELKSAVIFGFLFAAVTLISKAARASLGDAALYGAAIVAGATDVDAITLSTASLARDGLPLAVGATAIVLASIANTAVKAGIAFFSGGRSFGKRVGLAYLLMAVAGGVVVVAQRLLFDAS
ncbi:MAG: MgtC/SapB family protein [Deltaproteobacteria bacterium]|nr:MgtC/SapB family protein [Deltaproteobacteria bacterium]